MMKFLSLLFGFFKKNDDYRYMAEYEIDDICELNMRGPW